MSRIDSLALQFALALSLAACAGPLDGEADFEGEVEEEELASSEAALVGSGPTAIAAPVESPVSGHLGSCTGTWKTSSVGSGISDYSCKSFGCGIVTIKHPWGEWHQCVSKK